MGEAAGVWIRVSSGGQDEANQVPKIEKHCAAHGYDVKRTYTVHGKSASKGEHQADLDRALTDVRAGIITVLVIWHSDRIERRKGKALLDVLAEFSAAGCRVESVEEPTLGQLDFGGQVTTFIAGLVNHEKSAHLSQQVRLAHDRSRANGALIGRIPWGLTSTGDKYNRQIIPTEPGRAYVPKIFAMVTDGCSLADIAAWLTAEGVPPTGIKSARGRSKDRGKSAKWWPRTIAEMIRNPVYIGRHTDASGKTVTRCEPLVDAATFAAAGARLDNAPRRGPAGPRKAENRAMLWGAVFCGRDGCTAGPDSPMYRKYCASRKRGQKVTYVYYRCNGRGADARGCGNMVRLEIADAAMNALAVQWFTRPELVTRVERGHDHKAELAEIDYELDHLRARRLPRAEERAERDRLEAEYDRVAALPAEPDKPITEPTGRILADLWGALPIAERGKWLTEKGLTVCATNRAMWFRETDRADFPLINAEGYEIPDRKHLIYLYP